MNPNSFPTSLPFSSHKWNPSKYPAFPPSLTPFSHPPSLNLSSGQLTSSIVNSSCSSLISSSFFPFLVSNSLVGHFFFFLILFFFFSPRSIGQSCPPFEQKSKHRPQSANHNSFFFNQPTNQPSSLTYSFYSARITVLPATPSIHYPTHYTFIHSSFHSFLNLFIITSIKLYCIPFGL